MTFSLWKYIRVLIANLLAQPRTDARQQWISEPFYPSPWMNPDADGWEDAYQKAKTFVAKLTLLEKVNLTTGVGLVSEISQTARSCQPRIDCSS
jgi:beta-glucosidase